MTRFMLLLCLLIAQQLTSRGQIIIIKKDGTFTVPFERGFLPGKKMQYYPTIEKYNLLQAKFRVEVYDCRDSLQLEKVDCSVVRFTNTSEFSKPEGLEIVAKYADTLLKQANAVIDASAGDTIRIWLEGIDARLIGFGSIEAHGLCQIHVKFRNVSKSYCADITDSDKHSPISKNAFVTRKTATRIIGSAGIREVMELFIKDLAVTNATSAP